MFRWTFPLTAALTGTAGRVRPRFEWVSAPGGAAALAALMGAAALAALIWLLYRSEGGVGRMRWLLFAFRVLVLAAVGLLLLGPAVAHDRERTEPGRTVVLVDGSASMAFRDRHMDDDEAARWAAALGLSGPDEARAMSRQELVEAVLRGGLLEGLSARNEVEVVEFAGQTRTLLEVGRRQRPAEVPEVSATGETTALAAAVGRALEARRPAAVVCLTDGRETAGGDLEAAAREAAGRGVPLHFVGLGSPRAPRNVEVLRLVSNDTGMLGQPLAMRALVRAHGYAGRRVEVVLTVEAEGEEPVEVERATLELAEGRTREVDLTHVAETPGHVLYRAAIEPLPGEMQEDDNVAARRVRITERKTTVLLVAEAPSRQYRFLEPLLRRHPDFEADAILGDDDSPSDRTRLLEYDVVLLCDPPPGLFTEEWLDTLAELVAEEGLGLVFVAGPAYAAEALLQPGGERLHDLMPVVFDRSEVQAALDGPGVQSRRRALAAESLHHRIMQLGPEERPEEFWDRATGPYWAFPVLRSKRGATVFLRCSPAPRAAVEAPTMPLVAAHQFGLGRVLYCGSPETWRWRAESVGAWESFWLAAFRHGAAGRYAGPERRAAIHLESPGYRPGEPIAVRARLLDEELRPVTEDAVPMTLYREGSPVREIELRAAREPGLYEGVFYVESFGSYSLEYEAPDGLRASETFEAVQPEVEFADVRADVDAMRRAAELSGGRYFGPGELEELPGAVPDLSRTVVEPGPLEPAWDRWWLLAALVGLLTAEWALRKRLDMM